MNVTMHIHLDLYILYIDICIDIYMYIHIRVTRPIYPYLSIDRYAKRLYILMATWRIRS